MGKKLHGPAHYWRIMKRLTLDAGSFVLDDVVQETNTVSQSTVKAYLYALLKTGDVAVAKRREPRAKGGFANRYIVTHWSARAPVQRRPAFTGDKGRRQRQLWNAMRALPQWTIRELAIAASTEDVAVAEGIAQAYVLALQAAGAVLALRPYAKARPGSSGASAGLYRLKPSANTGPRPLEVQRIGALRVFDPNRNAYLGEETTKPSRRAAA